MTFLRDIGKALERPFRGHRKPPAKRVWAALAESRCKAVMIATPHGSFWCDPRDSTIGLSLFTKGEFEFAEFSSLMERLPAVAPLPQHAVFVDIGANIGTHTIYALNSGLFERAMCFEPEPGNFHLLQMNIRENGYEDRCDLFNIALGQAAGELTLGLAPENFGDHRIVTSGAGTRGTISVPVERLDDVLARLNVEAARCFMHMDVQGFEPWVLSGAPNFIAGCRAIYSEFWPEGLAMTDGVATFRKIVGQNFSSFIDVRTGLPGRPSALDEMFSLYAKGIGTNLLFVR